MATNRPEGVCHICGITVPLTYEHVPPRSAFNDEPADIFNYLDRASRDEAGNMSGGARQQGLPERYDFFLSFFRGPLGRTVGLSARFDGTGTSLLTEITYPPFSYLMTIDTQKPILPAGNISHFANYAYDEMATIRLNMVVGFGHTPFPGDFRSMADIKADRDLADYEQ